VLGMVKQQKVQTPDAIFSGIFDSKTRVKGGYNKIKCSTLFMYGLTRVLAEDDCRHFKSLLAVKLY
jgi:hypothetical protein